MKRFLLGAAMLGLLLLPLASTQAQTSPAEKTFDIAPTQNTINIMKGATPKLPSFPELDPKPGWVRGTIKDVNGKPLKGAKIGVRSTAVGGFYSGAQTQSDERGYYEVQVPWGRASFYCAGYTTDFGDSRAAFGLHPADGEADGFEAAKGVVKNWVLLPYGIANRDSASEHPQYEGNYYGGSLSVGYWVAQDEYAPADHLPVGSRIELTFTPTSPLLGGAKGSLIVVRHSIAASYNANFYVNNLPVATYRLSATLIHNGTLSELHIKETGPYANRPFGLAPKEATGSVSLSFRPNGAKAETAAAAQGNWGSLNITLSREAGDN